MGFVGAAVGAGAGMTGLVPVVEIMFIEFLGVALDQLVTEAAMMRHLSADQFTVPLVVRASVGSGLGFGCQHSQTLERWMFGTPGLKIAVASGARSAYQLLKSAIRDPDPVVLLEPRALYGTREEVPADATAGPLGRAEVVQAGGDATIVALGQTVNVARAAAGAARWSADIIDLRTLLPWDKDTVLESVSRTGRLVTVEENQYTGGWGAHIAAHAAGVSFGDLRAPVLRITAPDVHVAVPYIKELEETLPAVAGLPACGPAAGRGADQHRSATAALVGGTVMTPDTATRRDAVLAGRVGRYERMVEIRLIEEAVLDLFAQGLISGTTHTSQGQEAVAVAVAAASKPGDHVACTYRGHGIALAMGMTREAVLGEILGRQAGCISGMGGSMHLSDATVGLLPTFAIVGAGIPVAVGAALSAQVRGASDVALRGLRRRRR